MVKMQKIIQFNGCNLGKRAAVKLLMDKGADFEKIENADGSTAQELAQYENMLDIVR